VHVKVGAGDLEGWIGSVRMSQCEAVDMEIDFYLRVDCGFAGEALRCMIGAAARVVGGLVRFGKCAGKIWSLPLK